MVSSDAKALLTAASKSSESGGSAHKKWAIENPWLFVVKPSKLSAIACKCKCGFQFSTAIFAFVFYLTIWPMSAHASVSFQKLGVLSKFPNLVMDVPAWFPRS